MDLSPIWNPTLGCNQDERKKISRFARNDRKVVGWVEDGGRQEERTDLAAIWNPTLGCNQDERKKISRFARNDRKVVGWIEDGGKRTAWIWQPFETQHSGVIKMSG